MLSPKTKRQINRIIPFGVIWLIFGMVYLLIEKGLLGELDHYPSTGNPYDFGRNTFLYLLYIFASGLLFGVVEITLLKNLFARHSFGKKLLFKTLLYAIFMIVFLVKFAVINNSAELQTSIFDRQVWSNVWTFFVSYSFWSVEIYLAFGIVLSLFYAQVSENLGVEELHNFFTGKYHHPVEEERIFMFLDMRDSTTIAEKMGHVQFFDLLKAYYADLSEAVIDYAGEIYKYVGDEVIISWNLEKGLDKNNCLCCFFAMKKALADQSQKYESRFGVIPTFKAGIHLGKVTTGEIGVIKKEIFFTGDVLNTTARIQGLCNTYEVDLLISGQLKNRLHKEPEFQLKGLGESELRGREERVELFTVLSA